MSELSDAMKRIDWPKKYADMEAGVKDLFVEMMSDKYQPHPLTVRSIDGSPCLFIAEINGKEVGRMSISALPLVHDMEIPPSTIQRKIADALFHYASGKVKAAGFTEAVVIVENGNDRMHAYVKERGAVEEPKSSVFMMGVS